MAYQVQENIFPPRRNRPHPPTLLIKVVVFPVSSRDVTNQTLPGWELLNYSRPGRLWLLTSRLGTGYFFYSVTQAAWRVSTPVYLICVSGVNILQGPTFSVSLSVVANRFQQQQLSLLSYLPLEYVPVSNTLYMALGKHVNFKPRV